MGVLAASLGQPEDGVDDAIGVVVVGEGDVHRGADVPPAQREEVAQRSREEEAASNRKKQVSEQSVS